jgi:hypothetical protein
MRELVNIKASAFLSMAHFTTMSAVRYTYSADQSAFVWTAMHELGERALV